MKKLLISLLATLMLFGSFLTISAEGEDKPFCVGETCYETFEGALGTESTVTITMGSNYTGSLVIPEGKTVTLNLNSKTIVNKDDDAEKNHTIINKGTLIIEGEGTVDNVSHAKGALLNEGTATIKNGKFTRSREAGTGPNENGGNSWYVIQNKGTMTFEGGNVVSEGGYSSLVDNCKTMTINGGSFSNNFIAIKNEPESTLNINGGKIKGPQSVQTYGYTEIKGGELNGQVSVINYDIYNSKTIINGAKITGSVVAWLYSEENAKVEVEIKGNTVVDGAVKVIDKNKDEIEPNENAKILVSSGTFSSSVLKFVDNDKSSAKVDGTYYVGDAETVAEKAKSATTSVEVLKGLEVVNVPEGVKVTNSTGSPISVNGEIVEAGAVITVPVKEESTPSISCAGEKDKNCDGVVTCDEEKGEGWTWNNELKVCEYTGKTSYTVVNTAAK